MKEIRETIQKKCLLTAKNRLLQSFFCVYYNNHDNSIQAFIVAYVNSVKTAAKVDCEQVVCLIFFFYRFLYSLLLL